MDEMLLLDAGWLDHCIKGDCSSAEITHWACRFAQYLDVTEQACQWLEPCYKYYSLQLAAINWAKIASLIRRLRATVRSPGLLLSTDYNRLQIASWPHT